MSPVNFSSERKGFSSSDDDSLEETDISTVVANRKREEATIEVASQGHVRFSVWVSFAEIYQEQIYDLLVPVPKKKLSRRVMLQLREDRQGQPYVKGMCATGGNRSGNTHLVWLLANHNRLE